MNDLQYWGLDYPPLTAYVSFAFGKLGSVLVPELVEFQTSRGHESIAGKTFMRASVLLCDMMLVIPVFLFVSKMVSNVLLKFDNNGKNNRLVEFLHCLSVLVIPGLLLIDHGHFQYNGVCLAFALIGAWFISHDNDVLGSIFFCLSLNFKQMSLYYAPVFFCLLLRKCLAQSTTADRLISFTKLGITVIVTFAILWAPFCLDRAYRTMENNETCAATLLMVLQRQFPFSRGIFEDKVANIWYSLSVLIDFRTFLTSQQMLSASLMLTLALLFPVGFLLLSQPVGIVGFLLAMINSSLAFFLASFQVCCASL
jgi:alpha-1,3-glucosyltransferase